MNRQLLSAMLSFLAASICAADINEWTAQNQGTNWEILTSGTFKFESVTVGSLDDIGAITIGRNRDILLFE